MKTKTIYICNVCGKEHPDWLDAVGCHPDIIEKQVNVVEYKARSGAIVTNEE